MQTANIVSTPNITGNIGSCKTEVAKVTSSRDSIFYVETSEIATNSCTGQSEQFYSWEFAPAAFLFALIVGFVIMVPLLVAAERSGV